MKFISEWSLRPETRNAAIDRFLKTGGMPPAGVQLLARWHKADQSGGFSLSEADNAAAMLEYSAQWTDLIDIRIYPVVDDQEAAGVISRLFAK
jgi:hypothetical protein